MRRVIGLMMVGIVMAGCASEGTNSPKLFSGYWRSVEMHGAMFDKAYGLKLEMSVEGKGTLIFLAKEGADEVKAVTWRQTSATGAVLTGADAAEGYEVRVEGKNLTMVSKGNYARMMRVEE